MARTRTLLQMRDEVRDRTDTENDPHITDAQITRYLNQAGTVLYGRLLQKRGDQYFQTRTTLTTSAGGETTNLPAAFFKLLGMRWSHGSQQYTRVCSMELPEFLRRQMFGMQWARDSEVRYMIEQGVVRWFPVPQGVYSVELWYVPCWTDLSADGDTFDGINGWEELLVLEAAIKVQRKRERDTNELERDRAWLSGMVDALQDTRDYGEPQRVTMSDGDYLSNFPELTNRP